MWHLLFEARYLGTLTIRLGVSSKFRLLIDSCEGEEVSRVNRGPVNAIRLSSCSGGQSGC